LSYTTFKFDNLHLDRAEVEIGGQTAISLEVANTGPRAGDEVVQLYIQDIQASVTRPVKELKGFKRVSLQPGEKRTVTFTLSVNQLGFYNREMNFVVEPGLIKVMVGSSAEAIHLTDEFTIVGKPTDIGACKKFFSLVTVS
jgi:beta-glucosidase